MLLCRARWCGFSQYVMIWVYIYCMMIDGDTEKEAPRKFTVMKDRHFLSDPWWKSGLGFAVEELCRLEISDWRMNAHLKSVDRCTEMYWISTNSLNIYVRHLHNLYGKRLLRLHKYQLSSIKNWVLLLQNASVTLTTVSQAAHAQSTSPLLLRSSWGKLNGRELRIVPEVRSSVSALQPEKYSSESLRHLWVYAKLALNSTV